MSTGWHYERTCTRVSTSAKTRVDPSQCLVFEDAPAGVQAARNAAMNVVAVPHPENDQALFQHAGTPSL